MFRLRASLALALALGGCFDFDSLNAKDRDAGEDAADDAGAQRVRPTHVDALLDTFWDDPDHPADAPLDWNLEDGKFWRLNTTAGDLSRCEVSLAGPVCEPEPTIQLSSFRTVAQANSLVPTVAVVLFSKFEVPEGKGLIVTGDYPLVIASVEPAQIDGRISVTSLDYFSFALPDDEVRLQAPPGGLLGRWSSDTVAEDVQECPPPSPMEIAFGVGDCATVTVQEAVFFSGGGGGGNGGAGGAGGESHYEGDDPFLKNVTHGAGGVREAGVADGLLIGGGGGGAGRRPDKSKRQAHGGHGGGALQITSAAGIVIGRFGVVDANGVGGGAVTGEGAQGAGGGGGAGGLVYLEAPVVEIAGTVAAVGGGGGGGAGGLVYIEAPAVEFVGTVAAVGGGGGGGDDHGYAGALKSIGGSSSNEVGGTGGLRTVERPQNPPGAGNGGNGGDLSSAAGLAGEDASSATAICAAGGGGGSVGRIVVRADAGKFTIGAAAKVVPAAEELPLLRY